MVSLNGKMALIGGGSGEVGEGITRQFLKAGAAVIVPSRSQKRLATLQKRLAEAGTPTEHLHTLIANTTTPDGLDHLRDQIMADIGTLDAVVASLGGWWQGEPLIEIDLETWERLLTNGLTSHFLFAKTFLPLIADRPGSTYTMINGGAALHAVPNAGPVAISAAGQLHMKNVLTAENSGRAVRINTLLLATPVMTRSRTDGRHEWITADDAGLYAAYLASDEAAENGETIEFSNAAQLPTL